MSQGGDVTILSSHNGKRSRGEGEENLISGVNHCSEPGNLELEDKASPANDVENVEKAKDTASNVEVQLSGKRTKYADVTQGQSAVENLNTLKDSCIVGKDSVEVCIFKKVAEHAVDSFHDASDFNCTICSVQCNSVKDYNTHTAGRRHRNALLGINTHSDKSKQKLTIGIEAELPKSTSQEGVRMEGEIIAHGPINEKDSRACSNLNVTDLNICSLKDEVQNMGQETCNGSTLQKPVMAEKTVYDNSNENFCVHPATAYDLSNSLTFTKHSGSHYIKSIIDSLKCKCNLDCIAQALSTAFQVDSCPAHRNIPKDDSYHVVGAANAPALGDSDSMVSMHGQCLKDLLHEVQVKVMVDHLRCAFHESKGLNPNSWLGNESAISDSQPLEDDLYCSLCKVEFGSKVDSDSHVTGKKHASAITRMRSRCKLCNVNCNTEKDYTKHVNGKKHAAKLRLAQRMSRFSIESRAYFNREDWIDARDVKA
ncbi:hypothetical protein KP509_18G080800 [Ceratopteris richardii]|uniref:C2H2-type domain-containing protein n=1 Tax=Ceratopteris richardii TaxID=49495 RepID=A0A8T2SSU8_CERRI|nr:hypothetical protein KP509_18G080800 [Ceratopteris richardii]KAH7366487.1 hypothetical protein KP509_18G080800 [Ceratopteris richardii]